MKILCLTDAFWPDHAGGISKTVWFETEGLLARGHKLVAVSRRLGTAHSLHEARDGYELFRYVAPAMGSPLAPAYPLATLVNLPRLIRQIHKEYAFDVAYVNNVFQAAALLNSGCEIPLVYVFHASAYREIAIDLQQGKYGKLSMLARLANRGVRLLEKRVLDGADAIVVRSEFMRGEIRELYGERNEPKTKRIPLGIDIERFPFADDARKARAELGLPKDSGPVLLTVRRLVARTGVENLILAMERVVKAFPNALLLIVGRGYMENALRDLVRSRNLVNNVTLLGFVPEDRLSGYYQAADLFVLPTQAYEGFGLSTLEALSSGTPVVATPVGANTEVLGPLDSGLVMQGTDAESIGRDVIQWLERTPDGYWRSRCRNYCTENFTRDHVCRQIESVLAEVARA